MGETRADATTSCPDLAALEEWVLGGESDPALGRHVETCNRCRECVSEVRANNHLIARFARPGASDPPPATTVWSSVEPADLILGYTLGPELHRGGQGIVYEAVQKSTRRRVALKMLRPGALSTEKQRRRFEREIELVAGMRHPHIVTLFESGDTADGRRYFAMELIRGRPLNEAWQGRGDVASIRRLLELFIQICDAVQYAHQRGVIHRDLKPANILVDETGAPHILDFGVAKALGDDRHEGLLATRPGEFMGTFAYAAPEQVEGRIDVIDTRTDVYALGVMLYEALTGKLPSDVDRPLADAIRAITVETPVAPSRRNPALGDELDTIVLKALEKDRARRYQSAESLRQDLERFLRNEPIDARRDSTWYVVRKSLLRHRAAAAIASAFFLLIVAFAVVTAVNLRRTAVQRDKALRAEDAARDSAEQLAAALSQSNIERGRLMVRTGNIASAEEVLWREFLAAGDASPAGLDSIASSIRGGSKLLDLRDDYWALREAYVASHCRATVAAADAEIRLSLAVSPAGDTFATAGQDGAVQVWSLPLSTTSERLRLKVDPVFAASFCGPDRLVLLTVRGDYIALCLIDIRSGRLDVLDPPLAALADLRPSAVIARFSDDGRRVAMLDAHGMARIYDSSSGTLAGSVPYNVVGQVTVFALNLTGDQLAISGLDHLIRIHDVARGVEIRRIRTSPANPFRYISAMSFNADATQLAVGWGEGGVEVWDAVSGVRVANLREHTYGVTTVEFSTDGRRLITGGHDKSLINWELASNQRLMTCLGHRSTVLHAAFAAGGNAILSVGLDGLIKEWDTQPEPSIQRLAGHEAASFSVQCSQDGELIASAGAGPDNRLRVWNSRTLARTTSAEKHREAIGGVALLEPHGAMVSVSYGGEMRLWNVRPSGDGPPRLTLRRTIDTGIKVPSFVTASSDGLWVASGGYENRVSLWRVADLLRASSGASPPVHSISAASHRTPCAAFSRDGRLLAAASTDGTIRIIEIQSGRIILTFVAHEGTVRWARFLGDDDRLATCGDDGRARLWDVETLLRGAGRQRAATSAAAQSPEFIREFVGHEHAVLALDVSPDGRILATGARDGSIRLWSIADGRSLTTLEGQRQAVYSIAFTPDGRTLAAVGEDRDVFLFDLKYYDRHLAGNRAHQLARRDASSPNRE